MASRKEVFGVDVNGDITGLKNAMSDAVRVFNSTERALKNINKALEIDPTNDKLIEKQRALYEKAIRDNAAAVAKLKKIRNDIVTDPHFKSGMTDMLEKFTSVDLKIKEVEQSGRRLKTELSNLNSSVESKFVDKFNKLREAVDKSKESIKSIKGSLDDVNRQIELDPTSIDLYTKKHEILKQGIYKTLGALGNFAKKKRDLENDPGFLAGYTEYTEEWVKLEREIAETKETLKEFQEARSITPQQEMALNQFNKKFEDLKNNLDKSKKTLDTYDRSLKNIQKHIDFDPNNIDNYTDKQVELRNALKFTEDALADLKKRKEDIEKDPTFLANADKYKDEISQVDEQINVLTDSIIEYKKELARSPEQQMFMKEMELMGDAMSHVAESTREFSRACSAMLSTSFKSATSYESSIAGIKRVVSDLSDQTVKDLKSIAVETGNAFSDVADYATFAGALGLAEDEIATFSKAMIDLNAATGGAFSGEEGAKSIAVFLKQLGLSVDQAENFGSAVAYIGDKYADIGDETVRVATSLVGLTSTAKVSQYDLIGLAGIMADLGLSSESASSAITRSFIAVENAIAGTTEKDAAKLDTFAQTAGYSAKEFVQAWGDKPLDTFLRFVDGLKSSTFNEITDAVNTNSKAVQEYADTLGWSADFFKEKWGEDKTEVFDLYLKKLEEMGDEGESASAILKEVGLSGVRSAQTLLRLAGFGDRVRVAVDEATMAWNENTTLQEKSNIIYETTERKMQALEESARQFASSLMDGFIPVVKDTIDDLNNFLQVMSEMPPAAKFMTTSFLAVGASIYPVSRALTVLGRDFTHAQEGARLLSKFLGTRLGVAGVAGLATVAIVGGTVALANFLNKADTTSKRLAKLRDSAKETSDRFQELKTDVSNDVLNYDYQLRFYDKSVEKIGELISKIGDEKLSNDELKESRKELASELQNLNNELGTGYSYDATKNAILDENGEVVNLIDSYENLLLAKRKAFYVEANQEAYNQALIDQQQAYKNIAEAKWEYAKATEGADKALVGFAEMYARNPLDKDILTVYGQLSDKQKAFVVNTADAYLKSVGIVEASKKQVEDSKELIHNVDMIANSEGATLEKYLDIVKNGFNIDPSIQDLTEMKTELEKINFLLNNPEGLSNQNILDLESRKTLIEEQISQTQGAIDKAKELGDAQREKYKELYELNDEESRNYKNMYEGDGGIISTTNLSWDQIVQKVGESSTTIASDYKEKVMAAIAEVTAFASTNDIKQKIVVDYEGVRSGISSSQGSYYSGSFLPFSSGFGDLYRSTLDSIRNTINSSAFQSGGFSTGSIVFTNNFNITNGNSVTREVIEGWADIMTERINDNLGKMV